MMKIITTDKLKQSYRNTSKNTTTYKLLQNQLATLKKMAHPHISPLYDLVIDPYSNVFLISRYVPHITMQGMLEKGIKIVPDKARRYFQQLIFAIDYCHTYAGIVHRNICLQNIMINENDDVLLSDIGYAFLLEDEEGSANMNGAIYYKAPELMKEGYYRNEKTDIWAAGVSLYYMIEGTLPFLGASLEHLNFAVTNAK